MSERAGERAAAHRLVLANDLAAVLAERGLVPTNCRRILIDMQAGKPAVLYYELFADDRLLTVFREVDLRIEGA